MDRARIERLQVGGVLAVLAVPLAVFFYLREHPTLDALVQIPTKHFYVVSAAALSALALAVLVGIASVRSRQPRTFFLAAAFLVIAGIFATHGLATPGVVVHGFHKSISVSARLSLLLGGLFFALSAIEPPAMIGRFVGRCHGRLFAGVLVALALYVGGNLAYPALLDWVPTGSGTGSARTPSHEASPGSGHSGPASQASYGGATGYADYSSTGDPYGGCGPGSYGSPAGAVPASVAGSAASGPGAADWLGYGMAIVAAGALLFAAWRYYRVFSLARLPAAEALSVGLILLAESQVSMTFGETWRLS
jgi:hypothetical protein